MFKIKCDDEVIVIVGKDKGKCGKVQCVLLNGCLIVVGVNVVKKYVCVNLNCGIQGGIVEQEVGIDVFNVVIWNFKVEKVDCVGFCVEDGDKVCFFKFSGEMLDV